MRTANEIAVASAVLVLAVAPLLLMPGATPAARPAMVPTPVVRSTLPIRRPQAQPTLASTGARSRPANVSNGSESG